MTDQLTTDDGRHYAFANELLPHRTIEPMFQSREGLGREEGTATPDATARATGVRLEEVE